MSAGTPTSTRKRKTPEEELMDTLPVQPGQIGAPPPGLGGGLEMPGLQPRYSGNLRDEAGPTAGLTQGSPQPALADAAPTAGLAPVQDSPGAPALAASAPAPDSTPPTSGFMAGNPLLQGMPQPPGSPAPPGLTATLARQMLQRPGANDQLPELMDFRRRTEPRMRMDMARIGDPPSQGNNWGLSTPDPNADLGARVHDRSMQAFQALEGMGSQQEKMALEKYRDVGRLGNETTQTGIHGGQLEVAQRGQQEAERKGAFERDRNTEAIKSYQLAVSQGKSHTEALRIAQGVLGLGAQQGFSPGGFQVNPGNPTGSPRPIPMPPGTPGAGGTGGVQDLGDAGEVFRRNAEQGPLVGKFKPGQGDQTINYDKEFGLPITSRVEEMLKASKGLPEIAVAMRSAMGDQEFASKLPMIQQYLSGKFGGPAEWDYFVNPTGLRQFGRRTSNVFNRFSPEEILMSQIRNQQGLGPPNEIGLGRGITNQFRNLFGR